MKIDKIATEVKYMIEIPEDGLKCIYELLKREIGGYEVCDSVTYDVYHELKKVFEPNKIENEIDKLGNYILANCPDEIGKGNPVHGESAADVAIRLIERFLPMLQRMTNTTKINTSINSSNENGFYNRNTSNHPKVTFEEHK